METPTTEQSGHFDQLGERIIAQRQQAQESRAAWQAKRDAREKLYRDAVAVRETRKAAGEGTPPREVQSWGTWQEERITEFLSFARSKDFRGSTVIQWTETPDPVAEQVATPTDTRQRFGKRLLAGLRRNHTITVPEEVTAEPEPTVTREMHAYPIGYAGGGTAFLCEDGTLRQTRDGGNPEPLGIMGTQAPYESYAGQAKEPYYDRDTYQPIMVQLDDLATRHLIG